MAGASLPAAAAAAAPVLNATQLRENRLSHDRWARSAEKKPAPKHAAADTPKDAPEETETPAVAPKHRGELNGKLRLGEW
jgi:hypothetical protein